MLTLKYSSHFKKDLKAYKNNCVFLNELERVLDILVGGQAFPDKHNPHPLLGEFKDCLAYHIKPDVLLVYKIEKDKLLVLLLRLGSHANIFRD